MQVFVVLNASRPVELGEAIAVAFPHDFIKLQEGQWLVAGHLITSREVCDRIGASDGANGNVIVVSVDAYWGRAPGSIWEWIATRKAANGQ